MKKMLALLLVAVMCLSFAACDIDALMENDTGYAPNGLEYRINEDGKTCTIVGIGKCTDTVVEIPQTIKKYKVTSIGKEAFCVPAKQENEICVSITDFILSSAFIIILYKSSYEISEPKSIFLEFKLLYNTRFITSCIWTFNNNL